MLQNEYFFTEIGFDTAENEPSKICKKNCQNSNRSCVVQVSGYVLVERKRINDVDVPALAPSAGLLNSVSFPTAQYVDRCFLFPWIVQELRRGNSPCTVASTVAI